MKIGSHLITRAAKQHGEADTSHRAASVVIIRRELVFGVARMCFQCEAGQRVARGGLSTAGSPLAGAPSHVLVLVLLSGICGCTSQPWSPEQLTPDKPKDEHVRPWGGSDLAFAGHAVPAVLVLPPCSCRVGAEEPRGPVTVTGVCAVYVFFTLLWSSYLAQSFYFFPN